MTLGLLVLSPGKWHGRLIALTRPVFVIGRDARCHLRPASSAVALQHCAIFSDNGEAVLHALESTPGTYVNGQRLTGSVTLQHDDRIKVGPIEFAVCLERRVSPGSSGTTPSLAALDSDTVLESTANAPPVKQATPRRMSSSEAAGSLLMEYMRQNR
jgi:pSer/pThr/pTyr-binding forkhead associated (FHA) protein